MFSRRRRRDPPDRPSHRHHDHHHHHHRRHHDELPNRRDSHEEETPPAQPPEAPAQRSSEERREIHLLDLDAPVTGRQNIKIGAKTTSSLEHVGVFLKKYGFGPHKGAAKIPPDGHFEFFHEQERLHGNEIPRGASTLWYRVLDPQDDGLFDVIMDTPLGDNEMLHPSELLDIARKIESGATVGELRRIVASLLAGRGARWMLPERVVIEAVGGFRPGPLQGDNWECKNVKMWLCRHLTIYIVHWQDMYTFYGFNEKYVLTNILHQTPMTLRSIKRLIRSRVLTTVCQTTEHLGGIRTDDISLSYFYPDHRRVMTDDTRLPPGMSFHIELSRDAEDKFLESEAWLLPLTETCNVCAEEKRVSEMPAQKRITRDCQHDAATCKDCVSQWITSSMETLTWDRLKCPECPQPLGFVDVAKYATKDVFIKYDRLATKAVVEGIKGFRWCLNPKCDGGQIYQSRCEKGRCHACSSVMCLSHDVPWHHGESCREYDKRIREQRKDNELSEKHIKKIAKPCPSCNKKINKHSGCDHMTCVCGHEWCWLCSAPYTRDADAFLHCKHARECLYSIHPPYWEGREALLPFLAGGDRPPNFGGRRRPPGDGPRLRGEGAMGDEDVNFMPLAPPNRPDSPERRPRNLPPGNLFDIVFEGLAEGNRENRGNRDVRRDGFALNNAMQFQLAELILRAPR